MAPWHLLQLAYSVRQNSRLEWIRHLRGHPDHVVRIVAIQSAAFTLAFVVGALVWYFHR